MVVRMDLPPGYPESIPDVKDYGGIIVFGGNLENTVTVLNRLQNGMKIPLLVGADLERGLGQQVEGGCNFPHARGLAELYRKTNDVSAMYDSARQTAREARTLGIHMNFAPVADVNTRPDNPIIGIRSFGADPDIVAACCNEYIRGLHDGGMASTAKHFPGHGDTRTDSHIDLPSVELDSETVDKRHLSPFQACIAGDVDAVMVGHIAVPALDSSGLPASLSPSMVTGVLRQRMEFDGVVVTDAMNMGAITNRFSPADAAIRAINAGVDIVLMPDAPDIVASVENAVMEGVIPIDRIDEAVNRVLALKRRLGLFENRTASGLFQSDAQLPLKLARECMTFIRGHSPRFDIRPEIILCLMKKDGVSWLQEKLRSHENVTVLTVADVPPQRPLDRPYVLLTDIQPRAWSGGTGFPELWSRKIEKTFTPNDLLITLGSPHITNDLQNVHNVLCTYSASVESQREVYKLFFELR